MFVKFQADQKFMLLFLMNTLIDCCKLISFICIVYCFIMYYIYGITELRIDFDVDIMSIFNKEIIYFFFEDIQKNKFMFCKVVKNI